MKEYPSSSGGYSSWRVALWGVAGLILMLALILLAIRVWSYFDWYVAPGTRGAGDRKDVVAAVVSLFGDVLTPLLGASFVLLGFYITRETIKLSRESADRSAQVTAATLDMSRESAKQSARASQESAMLAERTRLTELFLRAIDQLSATSVDGTKLIEIRIGGIHTLGRIASVSPVQEYESVASVLVAYIRENATFVDTKAYNEPTDGVEAALDVPGKPTADVQAALDVLRKLQPTGTSETDAFIDLSGTTLQGANLDSAHLQRANLAGTNLSSAHLQGANLTRAHLEGADLIEANLRGAHLMGANL